MNLPAVILFICFSAAYGLQCKVGYEAAATVNGKEENVKSVQYTPCNSYCARGDLAIGFDLEQFERGSGSAHGAVYFCTNPLSYPCKNEQGKEVICHMELEKRNDLCHGQKDGKCFKAALMIDTLLNMDASFCCSKDSEFTQAPSRKDNKEATSHSQKLYKELKSGKEPSSEYLRSQASSTTSEITTRALLAIIFAFLGIVM